MSSKIGVNLCSASKPAKDFSLCRYWNSGWAVSPFTSILENCGKEIPKFKEQKSEIS